MEPTQGQETRTESGAGDLIDGPGPYLAKVKNHLDGEYMGRLEVELLKFSSEGNSTETTGQMATVSYLSPFYGVTPFKGVTENEGNQYSQSSYGFWAVPPDVDTTVMVIFAEGNRGQGFWIGCVQDTYMNFMTPGRASTGFNDEASGELRPVNEYNKINEDGAGNNPTQFIKPCDVDACAMLDRSGLMNDAIRGHTSSSARREVPSMVFGMSTPGPADWRNGSPRVSYGEEFGQSQVPFNRLGGSTLVMDDGDPSMYRTSPPGVGPSAYAPLSEGGLPEYPANELIRMRTRTGHQILMHNSEDLIYIQHANGTYIEFTSNGKIDIYAKDSVSIHSENDINMKSDRNINIEAANAINLKAGTNIHQEATADFNLKVGANGKITTGGRTNITAGGVYVTSNPVHFNGPPAEGAAGSPSPTRVPAGGGWTGSENRNPAAHTPEATENVEGTSAPPTNGTDGTTATTTPQQAGEQPARDTFEQCSPMDDTGTDQSQEDLRQQDPNTTRDPETAQVTNPDEADPNANAGVDGPADATANAAQGGDATTPPQTDEQLDADSEDTGFTPPPEAYDPRKDPRYERFYPQEDPDANDPRGDQIGTPTFSEANPTATKDPSKATVTASKDTYQYSDAYLRRQAKRARARGDSGSSTRGGRRG